MCENCKRMIVNCKRIYTIKEMYGNDRVQTSFTSFTRLFEVRYAHDTKFELKSKEKLN